MAQAALATERPAAGKALPYYAAFVALGLASAALGPALPSLAAQTGSTISDVSWLFSARSLGYLLGSLIGGALYDRLPGHWVMSGALLLASSALMLAPAVPVLWTLIALLVVWGMGEGAIDTGGNALLLWSLGPRSGPAMNGLHFFFGAGAFLAPVFIAQALAAQTSFALPYRLMAVLILPVAAWLLTQRSPQPKQQSATTTPAERTPWALVASIAALFMFYVGAEASYGGWVFTYASERGLASPATSAYLTSAFWGAITAGRLAAIPLASRYRPQVLLSVDLAGCLASMLLLLGASNSVEALWAGTIGLGFFMASVFPTLITLAGQYMHVSGQITGLFLVGASLGKMTVPRLIGASFEQVGPLSVPVLITGVLVLEIALFVVVLRRLTLRHTIRASESV